jgi:hypothetical protein
MTKKIYLDFSGWCELHPDTRMVYIGYEEDDHYLVASDWAELPKHRQDLYILEDAVAAMRDGGEMEWHTLDVEAVVEEEE